MKPAHVQPQVQELAADSASWGTDSTSMRAVFGGGRDEWVTGLRGPVRVCVSHDQSITEDMARD